MVRTEYRVVGERACYLLTGLDSRYRAAARGLGFGERGDELARYFPADSPGLGPIYANFARHAEDLLAQKAGVRPVPWAGALERLLGRLAGQSLTWYLVGSAALAVRGLDVAPGDIDIVADGAAARQLGELLWDDLIEPFVPVQGWVCDWFGRAFLGACVDCVCGVDARADRPFVSDFGPAAASRLETVAWRGHQLRVPPLDLHLAASERRGRARTTELIRRALRA